MKNSSDTIGNRTRDLPTCSAVPQPTAPPRICFMQQIGHAANLKRNTVSYVLFPCLKEYLHSCSPQRSPLWHTSLLTLQGVYQLHGTNEQHKHTLFYLLFLTRAGSGILLPSGVLEIFAVLEVSLFTQFGELLYFIGIFVMRHDDSRKIYQKHLSDC